jgi:hypothetical protein
MKSHTKFPSRELFFTFPWLNLAVLQGRMSPSECHWKTAALYVNRRHETNVRSETRNCGPLNSELEGGIPPP